MPSFSPISKRVDRFRTFAAILAKTGLAELSVARPVACSQLSIFRRRRLVSLPERNGITSLRRPRARSCRFRAPSIIAVLQEDLRSSERRHLEPQTLMAAMRPTESILEITMRKPHGPTDVGPNAPASAARSATPSRHGYPVLRPRSPKLARGA